MASLVDDRRSSRSECVGLYSPSGQEGSVHGLRHDSIVLVIPPEAISKPQMAFEGKAKADEKAQHTREYVSILKRL